MNVKKCLYNSHKQHVVVDVFAVHCKKNRYQEYPFLVIFEKLKQKKQYAGESKYRMERILER